MKFIKGWFIDPPIALIIFCIQLISKLIGLVIFAGTLVVLSIFFVGVVLVASVFGAFLQAKNYLEKDSK